mgnify:CR=1 FL=1
MNRFISISKTILILTLVVILNFGLAQFVLAADCGSGVGLKNPLNSCTFAALAQNVAKIVAQIGFPIAALAIIYSGFLFVTAQGNEKQLQDAKRTFLWTIIGTAILLGAWAIATAVQTFITGL